MEAGTPAARLNGVARGKRVLVDLSERVAEGKMKWSDLGGDSNRIWWIGGEGEESKMTLGF